MSEHDVQLRSLAGDFPARDLAQWQDLVAGVVNKSRGEDAQLDGPHAAESLRSNLPGGLTVDPLYLRPTNATPLGLPGAMPFTRGRALPEADHSWDVRALHDDPDAALTRAAVLDDLERGVTSIWLQVGADGLAAADIGNALAEVRAELAPVAVSSWDDQPAAANALLAWFDQRGVGSGNLGLDPLGAAARTGTAPDLAALAATVRRTTARGGIRAITIDVRPYRDSGATAVQEIAYAVATGIAYLRLLEEAGIEPAAAFARSSSGSVRPPTSS